MFPKFVTRLSPYSKASRFTYSNARTQRYQAYLDGHGLIARTKDFNVSNTNFIEKVPLMFRNGAFFRLLIAFLMLAHQAYCQLTTAEEKGVPPNAPFHVAGIDMVNLQNGNLHISIPILALKQRGGTVLKWGLIYDLPTYTKTFFPECPPPPLDYNVYADPNANPQPVRCPQEGQGHYEVLESTRNSTHWRFTDPLNWDVSYIETEQTCPIPVDHNYSPLGAEGFLAYHSMTVRSRWLAIDPEGTAHPIPIRSEGYTAEGAVLTTCLGHNLKGPSLDGSGLFYDMNSSDTFTVYQDVLRTKNGGKLTHNPNTFQDSNGNLIDATGDTLGRNPVTISYDPNYDPSNAASRPQYTIYTVRDSSGHDQQYKVEYRNVPFQSSICSQSGVPGSAVNSNRTCSEDGAPFPEVSRITLPDGRAYAFIYNDNSPGELSHISLPTGASIDYTYQDYYQISLNSHGLDNNVVGGRAVKTRTVSMNGHSYTWTYDITLDNATVTAPDGSVQKHTYARLAAPMVAGGTLSKLTDGAYETDLEYREKDGTVTRSEHYDYGREYNPLDDNVVNVRKTATTVTLHGGLVSKQETDYDTFSWTCDSQVCGSYATLATRLNPAEVREYGYGSGSPGSLMRKTGYAYLHDGAGSYLDANIVDRVSSITVYDGAGNQASQSTNEYDVYTRNGQSMTASGASHHTSSFNTSYQLRGNLTAVSKWAGGNAYITTTYRYDDAGNVISAYDPKGNRTDYDYTDSWNNTSCLPAGIVAKAFPTLITNAKNQQTKRNYNVCTGTLASITDPNNKSIQYSYDSLGRVLTESHPDGGSISNCYTDDSTSPCASSDFGVVSTTAMGPGTSSVQTTYYDGLGSPRSSELTSDPQGISYQRKIYDDQARLLSSANPTRSTNAANDEVTTYDYDSLGRVISQNNPDGSSVTWTYDGNKLTVKDESGRKSQRITDALGRLTDVYEDSDNGGLNLHTEYTYDILGNLNVVTQHGSSPGSERSRTFKYDSLSHLLWSHNPETGVICYGHGDGTEGGCQADGYDGNGNLLYKTDARGVTISYSYDSLNRLTSKSYSNFSSNTPWACYQYDTSSIGYPNANLVGRLTHEWTQSGGCDSSNLLAAKTRRSIRSYDAMGRVRVEERCVWTNCSTSSTPFALHFDYDLAGNLTEYDNGIRNLTLTNIYDATGRLNKVTSTAYDLTHPNTLYNVSSFFPNGTPAVFDLGLHLNANQGLDNRLRPTTMKVVVK